MTEPSEAASANLAHWDESVASHVESYDTAGLAADPTRLTDVVRLDRELMAPHLPGGSVAGLDLVHLQCHIGTDSISWARLGARVVGVDFSGQAVAAATTLAAQAGLADRASFIQADVAGAASALAGRRFDVVYTSVGVLTWLPELTSWAQTIAALLAPGGLFYIREDHPMVYAMAQAAVDGQVSLAFPYFNTGPIVCDEPFDYTGAVLAHARTYEWNHSLSEIIGSLLAAGLTIEAFAEYQRADWPYFGSAMVRDETTPGSWVLPDHPERLPLTFSLAARARGLTAGG